MAHNDWAACGNAFDAALFVDTSGYTFGAGFTRDQQIELAKTNISRLAKSYKNVAVTSEHFYRISIMSYPIDAKYFSKELGDVCSFAKKVTSLSKLDIQGYLSIYGETI